MNETILMIMLQAIMVIFFIVGFNGVRRQEREKQRNEKERKS